MPVTDYTRGSLPVRMRKVGRYVRLYGIRRTLVKVQGQYHMRGKTLRPRSRGLRSDAHVAVIGCGNFAFTTVAYFLDRNAGAVIRATMDTDLTRARSLAKHYRAHYATSDPTRLLDDESIDLVYVCSNHASHAEYAIAALERGKAVHIEKPHVVDDDQLIRLCAAMQRAESRVSLGFNRTVSPFGMEIIEQCARTQGPLNASWFVVGYRLRPDHWYNDAGEGGRVLGNLCHWTDFLYTVIPPAERYPIEIVPLRNDDDIAVHLRFGAAAAATVTFTGSGETFEGVRESLKLQKGDLIASITDFSEMNLDSGQRRKRVRLRHRDHGHEASVMRSYAMSGPGGRLAGQALKYVWETAELYLKVREGLESGDRVIVEEFDPSRPGRGW